MQRNSPTTVATGLQGDRNEHDLSTEIRERDPRPRDGFHEGSRLDINDGTFESYKLGVVNDEVWIALR